jgi:hypothetical protein
VAVHFGELTVLASTSSGAATLLQAWPHKTLCDQLRRCFGAWMRQIMGTGTLGDVGGLECKVEISWQTCRSRWSGAGDW